MPTVILIAITLVAGVAIAGFAFGLFGTLGTTANISVKSVVCTAAVGAGGNATARIAVSVANSGGSAGVVNGVSPSNLGPVEGTGNAVTISANTATAVVYLRATTAGLASGQTITGNLLVNGGSPVPFSASCT